MLNVYLSTTLWGFFFFENWVQSAEYDFGNMFSFFSTRGKISTVLIKTAVSQQLSRVTVQICQLKTGHGRHKTRIECNRIEHPPPPKKKRELGGTTAMTKNILFSSFFPPLKKMENFYGWTPLRFPDAAWYRVCKITSCENM